MYDAKPQSKASETPNVRNYFQELQIVSRVSCLKRM